MDCSASEHPLFARITAAWDGESDEARRRGVALDVTLIHIASMSNLAAALGWVLVDLLGHPHEQDRVHSGDGALAEQCALESTRLAQRSIMPRYVLAELDFDTGDATYRVAPGTTIATLLPLTNTTAGPGLHEWDPRRWHRHRLVEPGLACPQLVTAFGHGKHSCPAQPFSLAAMATAAMHLFGAYEMTPQWSAPRCRCRPRSVGSPGRLGRRRSAIGVDRAESAARQAHLQQAENDCDAIANGLPLYTCNPEDFEGIPALDPHSVPHPDRQKLRVAIARLVATSSGTDTQLQSSQRPDAPTFQRSTITCTPGSTWP